MSSRLHPHRLKPFFSVPRCAWCARPYAPHQVKTTDDDQKICIDQVYCELARVRFLRRTDRRARGVSTVRVRVGRWAA